MKDNAIFIDTDIDIQTLQKDLNTAIYMLHYLEEVFSKEEIRDVCFSLKNINDNLRENKSTGI